MKPKMQLPGTLDAHKPEFENFDTIVRIVMFKKSIGRKRNEAKLVANPVPPQVVEHHEEGRLPRP